MQNERNRKEHACKIMQNERNMKCCQSIWNQQNNSSIHFRACLGMDFGIMLDLEYADSHKTLESDTPPKAIAITIDGSSYMYIYIIIYIYIWYRTMWECTYVHIQYIAWCISQISQFYNVPWDQQTREFLFKASATSYSIACIPSKK